MRRIDALALCLGLLLAGCKFVPTASKAGNEGGGAKFDPDKTVADIWEPKVIPYLTAKAGSFTDVRSLAKSNPEAAGQKYGYKEKQGTSPWTVIVRIEGKIIAANTESRASSIDVDADGDGAADARIQIGPVMRGTALRDALDFVSFNDFTNQIDFAQFGKAFNTYVDKTITSKLPRDGLIGKSVKIMGAYPLGSPNELPLVTPATLELAASP
jgi:predicted lipoprotein